MKSAGVIIHMHCAKPARCRFCLTYIAANTYPPVISPLATVVALYRISAFLALSSVSFVFEFFLESLGGHFVCHILLRMHQHVPPIFLIFIRTKHELLFIETNKIC